jgi:hypothetical protein
MTKTPAFLGIGLAAAVTCMGQEIVTRIKDKAQLAAIMALAEQHAPKAKIFRIEEGPVLPTFDRYLATVWYDKTPRGRRRYSYKAIELTRPSEHGRGYDASRPFTYTFDRKVDAPSSEVFRSVKAKTEVLVSPTVSDETADRVLAFIEAQGAFSYSRGGPQKTLKAADILANPFSITTGERADLLNVNPSGHSLYITLRVSPGKVELVKVVPYVI